jgi:mannose-1-phosphate guanylyltransferase
MRLRSGPHSQFSEHFQRRWIEKSAVHLKAFLLAAGLGTRLRPITDTLPKCLVPIAGRPLLAHWMDLLERHEVSEVLINLHFLPEPVLRFVESYNGAVAIRTVMEPELLGSAGTLHANRAFVDGEEAFYILYADNLTTVDLAALARFNAEHPAPLTVGLFHAENPAACGIASLDKDGRIVEFIEKPEHPNGDLASAGIFVARPEIFSWIAPDRVPYDFGGHVMPHLVGRMNGVLVDGYLRDIGTLESLARAEREFLRDEGVQRDEGVGDDG